MWVSGPLTLEGSAGYLRFPACPTMIAALLCALRERTPTVALLRFLPSGSSQWEVAARDSRARREKTQYLLYSCLLVPPPHHCQPLCLSTAIVAVKHPPPSIVAALCGFLLASLVPSHLEVVKASTGLSLGPRFLTILSGFAYPCPHL